MHRLATAFTAIGFVSLFGANASADERAFSAQDVMSVCVAVAHDAKLAPMILESQGWSAVPLEDYPTFREDLAVAFLGASYVYPRPVHGTAEVAEFWKDAWPEILNFTDRTLGEESVVIYEHAASGAVLLTEPAWANTTTGMSCLLAVPESNLKNSSYFPKLTKPTAPAVSFTKGEFFFSDVVRSKVSATSASLDPEVISKALNISTDIGAAFSSDVRHPTWALKP
ncbi:MAG: hypothetical protein JNN02_09135 [Tabrizicola sp.]|nr:hypothetical protein [Tabrizicola sp.]